MQAYFYLFPIICTLAGGYFLARNIVHLRNEKKLRQYLETSAKAKRWVKRFGVEKTVMISRKVFLPLGCIISIGLILIGLWSLTLMALNG
jgi:hypothetical protein